MPGSRRMVADAPVKRSLTLAVERFAVQRFAVQRSLALPVERFAVNFGLTAVKLRFTASEASALQGAQATAQQHKCLFVSLQQVNHTHQPSCAFSKECPTDCPCSQNTSTPSLCAGSRATAAAGVCRSRKTPSSFCP